MIQKNFRFKNLQAAINGIDILRETIKDIPHRDLLINIFLSKINEKECRKILMEFGNKIENCKHIGISVYNFFGDKDKELIEFNIILSNNTDFYILEIPCLPERELQAAAECRNQLSKIPNVQGIEIFSVNTGLDLTKFLNALSLGYEEIPIFGAVARPDTEIGNSFAIGDTLIFSGFTLAIFSSEDLHIYMDYILGWNPIGKEMSITLGEKKENSECAISLIDGQPAVSIYEKYLGVCWNDLCIENIWVFPLMVRRNNVNLCYISTSSQNGTLYFNGTIYKDEKIRFSYCTKEEILNSTFTGSKKMNFFSPEAVFITLCGNRTGFLRDDAHIEIDYYKDSYPDLVYFHGNGEIYLQNKKGGLLNSAFVAIGMREGIKTFKQYNTCSLPQKNIKPSGKIPLSYLVSHFFHEMTNELLHFQEHLESQVEKKTRENINLSLHVVETLAQAIDAKDTYTNGHSSRVAKYAVEIAKRAGYTESQQHEIYMISLLHDVGKIGVPDEIINKPSRLTDAEYALIKMHPLMGAKILKSIKEMPKLNTGAHWHHEKYDGTGYPDGLKGTEIPEEARIIAVADAYDAMTSNRSYRGELSQNFVRSELVKGRGTQFDPYFADIMIEMIDEDKEYTMKE